MVKTAVIGASGFIGGHLFCKYRSEYADSVGTAYSRVTDGMTKFDLRNPDAALLNLRDTGHEAVVISSAMPLIGWCEANPEDSYALNVKGTLELARQLAEMNMHVIFLSSDYVFDGKTGGYTDKSVTCPVTEYGRQKAEVERELPNVTNNYTVARLSKIYGTGFMDKTIIDDIAMSLVEAKTIKVATDQFFSPTHVDDVVAMVMRIQEQEVKGLVNLCHSNKYSRDMIATRLIALLDVSPDLVQRISLHDIPGMESRPLDTSIIASACFEDMQSSLLSMEVAIAHVAKQWLQKNAAVS